MGPRKFQGNIGWWIIIRFAQIIVYFFSSFLHPSSTPSEPANCQPTAPPNLTLSTRFLPVKKAGSTISTLLHDKIQLKDCQVLFFLVVQGFSNFFRVVSIDEMANPENRGCPCLNSTSPAPRNMRSSLRRAGWGWMVDWCLVSLEEESAVSWRILGDRLIPLAPLSLVGFYI